MFFVGTGGFDPPTLTDTEAVQMALFGTAWLGLLIAWRWELPGAATTPGGMVLFYAAEFLADGQFPRGWAFAAVALPGALFLWCGLRGGRRPGMVPLRLRPPFAPSVPP